jgi:catalase
MASPPSEGERHEGHTPLEMFLEQHPAAARFVREAKPAPSSHARERYFGLSAYRLIDKEGKTTNVRFQILPAEGVEHLDAVRVMESGEDYLQEEMKARIEKGPATFGLVAQIAEEGDRTDDITEEWPESRKIVKLGEVKVEKVVEENASEQQKIIFDPIPRVDGVEPSDDPLLVFRAAVYLLSGRERRAAPGVESTKSK